MSHKKENLLMQVAALAKLYGLEARACGRAGQTFFRTAETRPLDADGQAQACLP